MDWKKMPMVPNRHAIAPKIYGDTPSFLGASVLNQENIHGEYDVIFAGVPWEGTVTWGSYTGCELAPRSVRHASLRYGGFLPEYGIDLFDHLKVADIGDISVNPNNPNETMKNVFIEMDKIYKNGSIPFVLGGDHSFAPEIIRALANNIEGQIGLIHFDSHFDNIIEYGDENCPRCSPIHRIAMIEKVRNESIAHVGIRGPRNSQVQAIYAREMGAKVFSIRDIRSKGIDHVIDEALKVATHKTDKIYVTICSDCIDAAFNPGGPADFNGLFPYELFSALYRLGENGIAGLDYAEIYPNQDKKSFSSHLASWAIIHALAGIASKKASQAVYAHS